ncbi:hypothetical protein D047_2785B, partial [Vibrio parahaemolyticus VPTS-2010_2]
SPLLPLDRSRIDRSIKQLQHLFICFQQRN